MKNTRKIQVLCSEEMYQTFERMMFWQRAEGLTEMKTMSSYIREHLQEIIDETPDSHKQSIKNIKR